MTSQERIISLLGQGLSAEIVATAIGCDPSYISQLLSNEEIHRKVSELRIQNLQAATQRDNKWDSIEDKLLEAMAAKVESSADFMKPGDLIRFLAVVNAAKRRGAQTQETMVVNNTIVNLTIPQQAVRMFTMNSSNQVIQVEGQSMLTLPSTNMRDLAKTKTPLALEAPSNEPTRSNLTTENRVESSGTLAEIAKKRIEKLLAVRSS